MEDVIEVKRTKLWIEKFIIGMNICPFAGKPFTTSSIRYVVCPEVDLIEVLASLEKEIVLLDGAAPHEIETTLILLPNVDLSFIEFNDFNMVVEDLLIYMGLTEKFQCVSFHPAFRYADSEADDPSNLTNRSPYPMLHLLRQASVEAVVDAEEGQQISESNFNKLRSLSPDELSAIIKKLHE